MSVQGRVGDGERVKSGGFVAGAVEGGAQYRRDGNAPLILSSRASEVSDDADGSRLVSEDADSAGTAPRSRVSESRGSVVVVRRGDRDGEVDVWPRP